MASIREYMEKMSTGQLERILERECGIWGEYNLNTIYLICDILAERTPGCTAREAFLRYCEAFADKNDL